VLRDEDGAGLRLTLKFSRPVKVAKAELAGRDVPLEVHGDTAYGNFSLEGLGDFATLRVSAQDEHSEKELDSKPQVRPRFNIEEDRWDGYEPGSDTHHRFEVKPHPKSTSVVVLVDCSGSMSTRMTHAKVSAKALIRSQQATEVSLWMFVLGEVQMVHDFTEDKDALVAAVDRLRAEGGTPLAAAIRQAGTHLLRQGRYRNRILLIVSDGQETHGGSPPHEIRRLREMARDPEGDVEIKKRGWQ